MQHSLHNKVLDFAVNTQHSQNRFGGICAS